MASNPVTVNIPRETHGNAFCSSNAAYWQVVTLGLSDGTSVVFQGSGEDVPMTTGNGQKSYPVADDRSAALPITCTFQYSRTGQGGTLNMAKVKDPVITQGGDGMTQILVVSEDDSDDDFNDSVLTFTVVPGPA
jgi:hypothetical protein